MRERERVAIVAGMSRESLGFSIPVIQGHALDVGTRVVPALIERIEQLRARGAGMVASNRGAFHSARDFHRALDPATQAMGTAIRSFAEAELQYWMRTTGAVRLAITECWAIAAGPGNYLIPHTHFPSPWSGVLYLDAEQVTAENWGGELVLFCPVATAQAFHMPPMLELAPKDGHIVLFPGALQHSVNPHRATAIRYSVAFNLMGYGPRVDGK